MNEPAPGPAIDRRVGAERAATHEALENAEAVVVLWSKTSVGSAWVKDEAGEGRDSGRLVPVAIGSAKPPLGFRQFQTIQLGGWEGRTAMIAGMARQIRIIELILGPVSSCPRLELNPIALGAVPWKIVLVTRAIATGNSELTPP